MTLTPATALNLPGGLPTHILRQIERGMPRLWPVWGSDDQEDTEDFRDNFLSAAGCHGPPRRH